MNAGVHIPNAPKADIPDLGNFGSGPRAWVHRLAASRRFQSWASRMPILRSKAKSEGEALFDLISGFAQTQTLFVLVDLGVLQTLSHGPARPKDLKLDLPDDRVPLLLNAGVAIDMLRWTGDRIALTRQGAAFLGVPGLVDMVRHHAVFYRDMADPVAVLKGVADTELAAFWPYVFGAAQADDPDVTRRYSQLMADSQVLVAEDTLRMVDFSDVACLMDVGGGTGAFLSAVGQAHPAPALHLFDLPAVVPGAESRFRAAGQSDRTTISGGSFRDDLLPTGADMISLIRVLYDHSDETVRALLAKVYDALPPGGSLIVSEPMTGGAHPTRPGDVYFAFYTLCMKTGRARSADQIAEMLQDAGFVDVDIPHAPRPFITSVVRGVRPS